MKYHICLLHEQAELARPWAAALGPLVEVCHYADPQVLLKSLLAGNGEVPTYYCIVTARLFPQAGIDILTSPLALNLKQGFSVPMFLNWPGSTRVIHKHPYFDGVISHQFGISFAALQVKVKRVYKKQLSCEQLSSTSCKKHQCRQVFLHMAQQAQGRHRQVLTTYADANDEQGQRFLEQVYLRLLSKEDRPPNCASRYIHSSPLIALRILREIFANV